MEELIKRIDTLIEESEENIISDAMDFIKIKSVQGEPKENAPFGEGPEEMLEFFKKAAKKEGFFVTDTKTGVVVSALYDRKPDVGIWIHGDVMPEGDGWNFEPYSPVVYKNCIIGRGASDNKGQLSAIFNLLKIIKKEGISLTLNPAIYLGSNEETGMEDVKAFLKENEPPALSLIPDGSFPVGTAGSGSINLILKSEISSGNILINGGLPDSPGYATAQKKEEKAPFLSFYSVPRHGSNPDPEGNMITKLGEALTEDASLKRIAEFMILCSKDIHGKVFGISTEHPFINQLTVFCGKITDGGGYPEIHLGIRYPVGITAKEILEKVGEKAKEYGFFIFSAKEACQPYELPSDSETVRILKTASNEVTGENEEPYAMCGLTYAHMLPEAYVFGTDANVPPGDFPPERGHVHGVDEAASVERLKRAMKIYSRALLRLNEKHKQGKNN